MTAGNQTGGYTTDEKLDANFGVKASLQYSSFGIAMKLFSA
jgi:hypothetical protein